jgi:hypothetical protein
VSGKRQDLGLSDANAPLPEVRDYLTARYVQRGELQPLAKTAIPHRYRTRLRIQIVPVFGR